ncbi:MAG: alpha/beta hydrolase [bacterium]|nr:alpha/beta hydrolase [bacterium]
MKRVLIVIGFFLLIILIVVVTVGVKFSSLSPKLVKGEYRIYPSEEGYNKMMAVYRDYLAGWNVPFREVDVDTSLGKTHVIISGENNKKPLVLLHGSGANSAINWKPYAAHFSKNFTVYAVDIIGQPGKSRLLKLPKTPEDYTRWLNEVYTGLELKKASLIGASYGGFIAHWFLHHYPGKVDKLAMFSFAPTKEGVPVSTAARMIYYAIFNSRSNMRKAMVWYNNGPFKSREYEKEMIDLVLETYEYTRSHLIVPTFLPEQAIKKISSPVLIILGEHDVVYNAKKSRDYCEETNPLIRFDVVPGAGHILGVEPESANTIKTKILDFLL